MLRKTIFAAIIIAAWAAGPAQAAGPATAQDRKFIIEAVKGDNSEIALGQLASERGYGRGIRNFGQILVRDHEQAREDASHLARRLGVFPGEAMMPEARMERRKLESLSGPAFDREFIRYMTMDHRSDLAKFRRQARLSSATSGLARRTLPSLKKHLWLAQHLKPNYR